MVPDLRGLKDSITLDAAYQSRGIPAVIDAFAAQAAQEVEDARDRTDDEWITVSADGDVGGTDDAAVVSDEDG